jgi:SAM-dependent methyltransferase
MTRKEVAPCLICRAGALDIMPEYAAFTRATSDSKPWQAGGQLAVCTNCGTVQKIPDAAWLEEIRSIYGAYEIYQQSAGAEQLIFDNCGQSEPRSAKLVNYVNQQVALPASGDLLDIGCGDGAALRNFSKALPGWQLYGSELGSSTIDSLRTIPGFVELFTGDLAEISGRFSLISIIHTLEHVLSPFAVLKKAANLLEPNGVLFIEVPDIETSPFDLLVADHLLHFSRETLSFLLSRTGFRPLSVRNDVIAKEITALAAYEEMEVGIPCADHGMQLARQTVGWLREVFAVAQGIAAQGPIGIFGTAIAGMALYSAVKDSVAFFVDEDPNRVGRRCDGKAIIAPMDAPRDVPIFLAYPPATAQAIALRCAQFGLRCVVPPPMPRAA